jgi:predicted nucleic acid-binding protein
MKRIVLDTDVSSLSIKDKLPPAERTSLGIAQFSITFVTLGELTQWATFRDWGPRNRARLERWLASKAILPYSEDVARKWGELSGFALRRGRPRPANDTWIAACCLVYEVPLATFNIKDFADFAEHHGLVIVAAGS